MTTITLTSAELGLLRSLVRMELRRTQHKLDRGALKWGSDFDPHRTLQRLELLRFCHRSLGGRALP